MVLTEFLVPQGTNLPTLNNFNAIFGFQLRINL